MGAVLSSDEGVVIVAVVLAGLYTAYTAYKAALPRPFPNIPYNRNAAHRLLGDLPEMVGYAMRTKRIFVSQNHHHHHHPKQSTSVCPGYIIANKWMTVLADGADGAAPKPHYSGFRQSLLLTVGGSDRPFRDPGYSPPASQGV